MATYSWNSNVVQTDPPQYFTLNVTFEDGVFRWNVVSQSNGHNDERNNIYGLSVTIGGKNYYRGDISWQNYSPWTVVYSGVTPIESCNIVDGLVQFDLSGNYFYGTWNSNYTSKLSQSIAITPPNVSWPQTPYIIIKPYNNDTIVSNISSLTFSFIASPGTIDEDEPHTITGYKLYIDSTQVYSGPDNTCTVPSPTSSGSHTVYFTATESNGALGTSETISFNTESYTYPSFESVESIRWSNGDSTGQELDDGEYGRMSATYNNGSVGNSEISSKCDISVSSFNGTITVSGAVLYTSSGILSPDYSYIVTYKLYDDFIGIDNAIIRSDTISIGLRGVEIVYDANDGYGIGIAKKGEPGTVDSALPLRLVSVDASGTITDAATLAYTPIELTPQITRSSGFTINQAKLFVFGRVAHLSIIFNASGTYNVGDNIFEGSISDVIPKGLAMGNGYWGSSVYNGLIDTNGIIKIRLSGYGQQYTFSGEADISWTFLF